MAAIVAMRSKRDAPVDSLGCEGFFKEDLPVRIARFHVLVGALLSSQTKDPVTAAAMGRLRAMPGLTHAYQPQGAFYAFPTVNGCFGKTTPSGKVLDDAEGVCLYLLEECLVALVPGEAFGDGNCLRISYATDMGTLQDAMDRMERGLAAIKP